MRPLRYISALALVACFGATDFASAQTVRDYANVYDAVLPEVAPPPVAKRGGAGSPDLSFGTDGVTAFTAGAVEGLAFQPDGKILAAGHRSGDAAIIRLFPDGSADSDFGTGGVASLDLGSNREIFRSVAVQPDGKILAAGSDLLTGSSDGDGALLARFNADGTLDTSFGTDGIVLELGTPESGTPDAFWSVHVRPDGRIIAGGLRGIVFSGPEDNACYAAQYLPDGSRDGSFGTDGLVSPDPDADIYCFGGALMPDGRYVLHADHTNFEWGAVRLLEDGSLDPSFGTDGIARAGGPIGFPTWGVAIGLDGSVAIGGFSTAPMATLVRFTSDGTLDSGFGDDGVARFPLPSTAQHVTIQPDGKYLFSGDTQLQSGEVVALVGRMLPDGTPDPDFGTSGIGYTTFEIVQGGIGWTVGLDAEHRVLVGGNDYGPSPDLGFVARFENDLPFASFFSDRAAFEDAFPGLPVEDLEDGNAPPNGSCTSPSPVTPESDNDCFDPGDIMEGLTIAASGPNEGAPNAMFSAQGGAFGWPSIVLGPNAFTDAVVLTFDPAVPAVGVDTYGGFVGSPKVAEVYDADGALLGTTAFTAEGEDTPVFVGASSSNALIGSVVMRRVEDDTPNVVVDNIAFGGSTVAAEPSALPGRLGLGAPFPNPATGRAVLPFTLAEAAAVRLALYDVLGREVAVLAEGTRAAGAHEVVLDAARLASGLYVARLTAGDEAATRRLTVVR